MSKPTKASDSQPSGEIVLFQSEDGQLKIQVRVEGQTVWMLQRLIAELFQVTVPTVNEHLANLCQEGEIGV